MAAFLKHRFEVFNGDYGNGWAAQTFSYWMKRGHNDKKGADEQLLRVHPEKSGWRVSLVIDNSVAVSKARQNTRMSFWTF